MADPLHTQITVLGSLTACSGSVWDISRRVQAGWPVLKVPVIAFVVGTEGVPSVQGYLYQLDDHLDRFYTSAGKAALVPPYARPQLRRIILETAAASQRFDGTFRELTCLILCGAFF